MDRLSRLARTGLLLCLLSPALPGASHAGDAATVRPDTFREYMSQALTGIWWLGIRPGAINLDRDPWEFGQFAMDSNDDSESVVLGSRSDQESFSLDNWDGSTEFFAGRNWQEGIDVEFRFGFAVFGADSSRSLRHLPSGGGNVQFWTPYLDGGHFPQTNRPRNDGIYGIRWGENGPSRLDLDYDAQIFDFGTDLLFSVIDEEDTKVRVVVGPAMAIVNQDFGFEICCGAHNSGGHGPGTEMTVSEDIQEIYGGLKLGAQGSQVVNEWLTLAGTGNAYLYGKHADLDGRQHIRPGGGGTPLRIDVDDESTEFAPRLTVRPGAIVNLEKLLPFLPLPENLSLGLFYEFNVWFNASRVENPGIVLRDLESDTRWIGNSEAHLDEETMITHGIQVEAIIHF